MHTLRRGWLSGWAAILALAFAARAGPWTDRWLSFPYRDFPLQEFTLQLVRQDHEQLQRNRSVLGSPLIIGSRRFERGWGTHSVSHIRLLSPEPLARFSAWVGIDWNDRTEGQRGSAVFSISTAGSELFRSPILRGGQEPEHIEVGVSNTTTLDLEVTDGGDGPGWDHADWAEASVVTRSGKTVRLDELAVAPPPWRGSSYPFSFHFGNRPCQELMPGWRHVSARDRSEMRIAMSSAWTDPATGLRVRWEAVSWLDFDALEWVLYFENTGTQETPLIEDVQAVDLTLDSPMSADAPYRLHRSQGAPSDPSDFEPTVVTIRRKETQRLSAGGGRSSNQDFPFFKIETGEGSLIVAVGWSGQWVASLESPDGHHLRVRAGMEKTRFKLYPGERVRSPRILVFFQIGNTWECNARFRQLIHRHYAARRSGQPQLPALFCNTCFTRGGGWLNECNASNQISLIRAYGSLGLEAVITDAGWFEGGWPKGAGNWTPRKDAYPEGMGPVAAAAKEQQMAYGLWFEPERVVAGTGLHREHPDWVLAGETTGQGTFLANFGLPEVQDYFFSIVSNFMALPGFRFYRQDFNMDPLRYWRHHDAPDRQGITEIRHVEGLYAYWERIATNWPDSLREECASGGRRIDLETVCRLPLHQKSDYWFDNTVDQASLWSLSQYLPNNLITVPLTRLDDYSFHSTLAASLIPAWIADAPDFDRARAKALLDRYRQIRHLLVGAWYPLLPYSRSPKEWIASQYHRPDLDEGMILVFRREESPYRTVEVALKGLDVHAEYALRFDSSGEVRHTTGGELTRQFLLTLPDRLRSELITYRRAAR